MTKNNQDKPNKKNAMKLFEQHNVPALRFPEFKGDWKIEKFEKLTKINQGLQIVISSRYTEKIEGSHFYITNEFLKKNSDKKFYILHPSESVLCNADDILMTRTGNTGQVVTNVAGAFHNNFFKIKFCREEINKDFLVCFLRLPKTQNNILILAGASTIPDLNHGDFYRIEMPYPPIIEQTKIATFLTAVDNRLKLLQTKKAELTKYKKGVMQKLFSQAIRFKDKNGDDFPDWKEKTFKDVYSFKTTNSLSRDKLNYKNGSVKNIHYGDIHTKFNSLFDIKKEYVPFINKDVNVSRISEDCYLQEGDLVIADASEDYNDIGKTIEIQNISGELLVAGLHTFLARGVSDDMAKGFASFLMKTYEVRLDIMKIAQGTKVLGISKGRLGLIPLLIPTLPEQIKIANFLTSIDKSIENISQQIDDSQDFKQGLLQKMFV
jgi:type I restriction enzyme S subunit